MHTANNALQHLANEPGLSFHVAASASAFGGWYAAFRDPGWEANELQPERGWGYGDTPEQAVHAAIESFRANEDEPTLADTFEAAIASGGDLVLTLG